ncbi:mRNA cap guanine-N7 methyltransferase [Anthophora plagiata]
MLPALGTLIRNSENKALEILSVVTDSVRCFRIVMPTPRRETMNEGKRRSQDDSERRPYKIPKISSEEKRKKASFNTEQNTSNILSSLSINDNKETKSSETPVCNGNAVLVVKHYNSILSESGSRHKSRIFYMRNFNNWIKSILINTYLTRIRSKYVHPINALDICCGKGGDLFKWKTGYMKKLIFVDLADVSVRECQNRYENILRKCSWNKEHLFAAEFITADCTKEQIRKKFKDPSISLDMVSCQFAFHYCFESLEQAECMMKNASECLKPEGYFIGTIPNAYELVSRWHRCDGNTFGNDIYNVEFLCDKTNPPLFGAKYYFQLEGVVNCPEFLVYLPVFIKLASKFGLELIMFERFDKFYEDKMVDGVNLLRKINVFECYPPWNGRTLGKAEKDYEHAKKYMQTHPNCRDIGTLSQPEWEVVSLYAVFAFQKKKTKWNNEGKPEYV